LSVRRLTDNKWDQRIERARELAEEYPFSAEILSFFSKLTAFQKSSYLELHSSSGHGNGRGSSLPAELDEANLKLLLTRWRPFLAMLQREAPAGLAEFARGMDASDASDAAKLLRSFWVGEPLVGAQSAVGASFLNAPMAREQGPPLRFCAQAFLQPYAEFLADHAAVPAREVRRPICPYCGSPPLVGALRQEGDCAKRSLVCSFCRTEWDYLRIACAGCEEYREEKLCVYSTPAFNSVRVEACDTCGAYIKTVDLTRNGLAVPEVDELAAIPLTLWANEKGYKKVTWNIMGL
jgi:FdhE protein